MPREHNLLRLDKRTLMKIVTQIKQEIKADDISERIYGT